MVDIRIVCARDAVKTAETLRRLLEAEQHRVNVSMDAIRSMNSLARSKAKRSLC